MTRVKHTLFKKRRKGIINFGSTVKFLFNFFSYLRDLTKIMRLLAVFEKNPRNRLGCFNGFLASYIGITGCFVVSFCGKPSGEVPLTVYNSER